jgi:UDP-2-acetamido-3-amino-2,3-dideoxy-glucuronate N-acetyltransferase
MVTSVQSGLTRTANGSLLHPQAVIDEGAHIGKDTRVWAFAHILSGAQIGEDCNICDHTFVEGGVIMGARVTIKCGVALWDGMIIEDDVFVGPNAVFTNDKRPRSRKYPEQYLQTVLRQGCSIGANSTILAEVTIGRWAMVGAGAVVTRSLPDYALVYGNPARQQGWVCRCGEKLAQGAGSVWACSCGFAYQLSAEGSLTEASI